MTITFAHVLLQSNAKPVDLTGFKGNERLYYKDNTLVYEYEIPETKSKFPLSGFLAIIDEVTSWAIHYEDKHGRPASVSTLLEAKIGKDFLNKLKTGDIVEFRGSVEKIGKNLGFASAEVFNVSTGTLICFGRQTKFFMPNNVLSQSTMKNKNCSTKHYTPILIPLDKALNVGNLENGNMAGKICFENHHRNTIGGLHGGYQAIIMEKVGFANVKIHFNSNDDPILESISISYLSSATKNFINFDISYIFLGNNSVSMKIRLKNDDSTAISEGILLWKRSFFMQSKY